MNNKNRNIEQKVHEVIGRLLSRDSLRGIGRDADDCRPLPSESAIDEITRLTRSVLFPGYFGDTEFNHLNLPYTLGVGVERLSRLLPKQIEAALYMDKTDCDSDRLKSLAREITVDFIEQLPQLRDMLALDAQAVYLGDPAAVSVSEVIYCYPTIRAITSYRIAHALSVLGVPVIPRMVSENAHRETGIDIHPGAQIGRSFMIDHGTGVVIGETTVIGDNVKIYQGVTLGARSFPTDSDNNPVKGLPRHPVIGDNVVIYANATILGRVNIGSGSVIGGNMWITYDVAPNSIVVQAKS